MNAVLFYSNTGQSKRIAEYFADQTGDPLFEINCLTQYRFDRAVLVFPVYSQNIPKDVQNFLRRSEVKNLIVIATYGRMCHGNVLYEVQHKFHKSVVAAAYVPTKHAYAQDAEFADFSVFEAIFAKIDAIDAVRIPRSYKNLFSDCLVGVRSRLGVTILKDRTRCTHCGVCAERCLYEAIADGVPNQNCIRCMRCVAVCPAAALRYRTNHFMKLYLKKKTRARVELFID